MLAKIPQVEFWPKKNQLYGYDSIQGSHIEWTDHELRNVLQDAFPDADTPILSNWITEIKARTCKKLSTFYPCLRFERESDGDSSILCNTFTGVLNCESKVVTPYDPKWKFSGRLLTIYVKDAIKTPEWEWVMGLMQEALPDEDIELLLDACANCLIPDCRNETALFCHGEGESAKSTLVLCVLDSLYGAFARHLTLSQMCAKQDTTPAILLENAIVDIGSEVDNREIRSTENFKRLVSGETITGRNLYDRQGEFASFAKMFFLMNVFPKMNGGAAENRRIRVIRFDKVIEKPDTSIKRKIVRPEIRNVIFSALVDRLPNVLNLSQFRNGSAKSVEWQQKIYRAIDRINACTEDCFEKQIGSRISDSDIDNRLIRWLHDNGYDPQYLLAFKRELYRQKGWETERFYPYKGSKLKDSFLVGYRLKD